MKLRKFGQAVLAAVAVAGLSLSLTSCVQSHTIGYLFVTGVTANGKPSGQVASYKIDNNTGNLTQVQGSPFSTGGTNPVDALVASSGRFLYVLNAGCADPTLYPTAKYPCASGQTPVASSIALFSIGGGGVLSFQQTYFSNGNNSVAMASDSGSNFLYVLDQNTPQVASTPAQYLPDGDVSVFSIDTNTGRLAAIQNQQVNQTNGEIPLNFFPVGVGPIWFNLFQQYLFTIDRDAGEVANPNYVSVYSSPSTGQLVATQNSEFNSGAINLSYIYGKNSYLYLLDAGDPTAANPTPAQLTGSILAYTTGANGALSPITGGAETQASRGYPDAVNPTVMAVDNTNKNLYVANTGPNTGTASPASSISSYNIIAGGTLNPVGGNNSGAVSSGTGSGPRCILEDPSNQFLFTANFNDSTISGFIINTSNGTLTPERRKATFTAPGNPTWCAASGTTF